MAEIKMLKKEIEKNRLEKPILKPVSDNKFQLVADYSVKLTSGETVLIYKGYQTNGADIPRLLWRLYPPYSPEYMPAVVIHDYLCDLADEKTDKKERKNAFLFADKAFKDILKQLNISKIKISLFYNAVRLHHKLKG